MKPTHERIADGVRLFQTMRAEPQNLEALMLHQRAFSTLLFQFAIEVGELYRRKGETEFQRKAAFNRARREYIKTGDSAARAESFAAVDIEALLEAEQRADADYKAAYLLLEHGRDVLQTITQHISHLKAEKRADTFGQGGQ